MDWLFLLSRPTNNHSIYIYRSSRTHNNNTTPTHKTSNDFFVYQLLCRGLVSPMKQVVRDIEAGLVFGPYRLSSYICLVCFARWYLRCMISYVTFVESLPLWLTVNISTYKGFISNGSYYGECTIQIVILYTVRVVAILPGPRHGDSIRVLIIVDRRRYQLGIILPVAVYPVAVDIIP